MSEHKGKRKCVYCGRSTGLTREHVCPDYLGKMMFPNRSFAFIGGANKVVITEVTIRDVCANCNNGVLAQLDTYGKELAARYFRNIVDDVAVRFEYDYDLLPRWLLKVLYNASRAYKSPSRAYEAYVPYIMGKSSKPPNMALLVGVWKPSFHRCSLYYPNDVRFSVLMIPDKPYTGLLLTSMFSVRSYAFIVLGWEDRAGPNDIAQTVTLVSQQFGATLLEEGGNQAFLNPAMSRLDYVSHRIAQAHANPWMLTEPPEEMKQRIPESKDIPVSLSPELSGFYTKVAIATFDEPRIAVFAVERLHPGLVIEETPIEEPNRAAANARASARITREGQKTYVDIVDHYELDETFSSGHLGIHQAEANWRSWRDAIRDNDDWLYISTLPSDNDTHKMRLVSKIRVLSVSEQ
jgi:hypothetical protein